MLSAIGAAGRCRRGRERLSLRVGVETGSAVVGPLWSGASAGYGAAGEVVEDGRRFAVGGEAWLGPGGPGHEGRH